mgnify:CR=1 FL=1
MNEQQIQELKNLVDKLQAEGLPQQQIQAQVDAKKQEFQQIEKPYNEGMSPDFQTPTAPGAVVEETVAPDMDSTSDPGSSDSLKELASTRLPGSFIPFRKQIGFVASLSDFGTNALEYIKGVSETATKYRSTQLVEQNKITQEQQNLLLNNVEEDFTELLEPLRSTTSKLQDLSGEMKKAVYEEADRSVYDEFFSEEGNALDGLDKITDNVIEALPSVMAVFTGTAGMATLFASASGGAYKEKTDADPKAIGDLSTLAISSGQGGVELVSELVTRGILKGFGNTVFSKITPNAIKNLYKNATKTLTGKVITGGTLEGTSENLAQEVNRRIDYEWGDNRNIDMYRNPDGSYNVGDIVERGFETFITGFIIGAPLASMNNNPVMQAYTLEKLSPTSAKKQTLESAKKINQLENLYSKAPSEAILDEILELQKSVVDNKILNKRVLESFDDAELSQYVENKFKISELKRQKNLTKDVETKDQIDKIITKQEQKVDNQYNDKLSRLIKILEKPIKPEGVLMSDFGIISAADKLREVALDKAKQTKISNDVQKIYEEKGAEGAFEIIEKFKPITNKLVRKRREAPNYDEQLLKDEIETGERGILDLIREYKPESGVPLSGYINKFLPARAIEASKRVLGEEFTQDVTEIRESRIELDDTTQETLDFVRTEPEAKEQLRDIAGITKESVQKDATQILKGKLPGIIEKSGRDKNEILTAINKVADFKIADAVLEEMGGNFNNKQEQNSRFTTFMDVNYDAIIKAIPNSVKNKLPLFEAKKIGREDMVQGDAAGKGVFEYKTPTKQEFINFYTEGGLNGLRAKKKRLASVLAQEIGKDAIAEVLADPNVQKEFLERQELQGKEIPEGAIPKLLQRIDRMIESVDQFGKTTLQGGPIPVVPAAKVFLNSLKVALKAGAKFSEALSKAIKKFKQALKGATKEQKSLAERIVGYHIKTIDDFNKLKESELIEDLNIFMNNDILNSSDIEDFASNAKNWKKLVKNVKGAGPAIDMRTETGRKKFLKIAEKNGFIEQIPESVWLTLQGTTDSLIPNKVKKELNLDKEELKTIRAADGSSLRTYGGNFPFKNVPEAKAWIDSMKAKGKKFAEEGVYKDMTKKVTKAQYDNLENLLNDKDFIQSQKNSLEGVKKLFLTFESLMKKNPKQNIPFVAAMLSSTSAFQGHFMRIASPVTFYEKGYKDVPYQQEHLMQASLVAKYLFLQATDGNIKKSFKYVAKNFQQGALSNKSDDKLKGIGYNGESFTYKEKTPPNWFIKDNIWARYFNINTALQGGGLLPENFVMAGGKTIADIYKVNNAGYGIKGVNFNNQVIQDFKVDEINAQAVKQVYKEKDLNKDFNNFLEKATGIGAQKVFSEAKAIARGKQTRKVFGDYFIPPGAEDFGGLMHRTLAKGKVGEQQLKFYKENLYDPFNAANESITRERRALTDDFRALKKKLSNVPNKLKNLTSGGDFTISNAVRAYIWNKQGMKIPGLSETDLKSLIDEVQNDSELLDFSNQLINITKSDGYVKPENNWLSGNIATDLMALFNTSKRSKHLEVWQNNVDQIFTKENLNKLEAAYGKNYRVNLEKTLERMKTGMNRKWGGNKTLQAYLDWVNGSVGAIMFLNTRSAVLQTISNVNYINFKDNNPLLAAKAYANQPQFWKDFKTIFNSDYLRERRGGNQINVNENELAKAAEKDGVQGTISLLLNKGFIFTKIADSFAIASGGAPMYRNRINTYVKQGLSQKEAEDKAFLDFKAITEETQQSSRPDRISEQQASNAGRLFLAFANTPMQYNRIIKRNAQDLVDGRGDPKEKVSKIIYYSTIQNLIFNAMQKALFALAFAGEDEDEKEIEKYSQVAEGMADSLLRGSGLTGNAVVAIKNVAVDIAKRAGNPRPNFQDAVWKAATISPPINNKISKGRGAGYSLGYVTPENVFEPKLDNPALSAGANIISAATNVPLDRALRKAQNIEAAMSDEAEWWQTTALLMGWGTWELGMENEKDKKEKLIKRKSINRQTIKRESITRK